MNISCEMACVRKGLWLETNDRRQTESKSRGKDDGQTRQDTESEEQGLRRSSSSKPPHRRSRSRSQQRDKFRNIDTLQRFEEQASVKMQGHRGRPGLTQSDVATERSFTSRRRASPNLPPSSHKSRSSTSQRTRDRNRDRSRSRCRPGRSTPNRYSSRCSSHSFRLPSSPVLANRLVNLIQGKQTELRVKPKDVQTGLKRKVEEDDFNELDFKRKSKERFLEIASNAEGTGVDDISVLANEGRRGRPGLTQSDVATERTFTNSPPSSHKSRSSPSQRTRDRNRDRSRSRCSPRRRTPNQYSSRCSSHSSRLPSPPVLAKRLLDPIQGKQTELRVKPKDVRTGLKRKVEEDDFNEQDFKRKSKERFLEIASNAEGTGVYDISVLANEGRRARPGLTQSHVATKRTFTHRLRASTSLPPRSHNSRSSTSQQTRDCNHDHSRDRNRFGCRPRTRTPSRYSSHSARLSSPPALLKRLVYPPQGKQTELKKKQKEVRTSLKQEHEMDDLNEQDFKRKSKRKFPEIAGKADATGGDDISVLAIKGHPAFLSSSKKAIGKEKLERASASEGVKRAACQGPIKTDWRADNFNNSEKKLKRHSNASQRYDRKETATTSSNGENYCCSHGHRGIRQKAKNEQRRRNDGDSILTEKYIHNLNAMSPIEILKKLNKKLNGLKGLLNISSGNFIKEEFLKDVLHVMATCCQVPSSENINPLLTVLKNSLFFSNHIQVYLQLLQGNDSNMTNIDQIRVISDMIRIFSTYLRHLPSSYSDVPLEMLQRTIEMLQVEETIELQNGLAALRTERDEVIKAERRRFAKPFQKQDSNQIKPPDNYREIQICPTLKELNSNEKPFLRKSIKKGKYEDAEHYLDVQFRLYREDFIAPLREGIQEVVNKVTKKERNQNIKLYHNVRILGKEFTKSGIVYKVIFDPKRFRFTNWNHSKRLIFGTFLCLSRDEFKTMLFATVANRDPVQLKNGKFDIQFVGGQDFVGIEKRNECFIIAESPAYFEAYRHVLVGLQGLKEENLPFKKYLVQCSPDVDSPLYLRRYEEHEPVTYSLQEVFKNQTVPPVKVLVTNDWPKAETLPLNVSQLDAFQTAITKEFTVIQGPPGTGKTYVGLKIVQALLENRRVWDPHRVSPMLMVCFTNHALDQFLEGVLEFLPHGIIRVGGRCKSQHLQGFNLRTFVEHDTRRSNIYSRMKEWEDYIVQSKAFSEAPNNVTFSDLEEVIEDRFLNQLYYHPNLRENKTVSDLFKAWVSNKFPATERGEKYSTTAWQETNQTSRTEYPHDINTKQADKRKLSRAAEQQENREQESNDTSEGEGDSMEIQEQFVNHSFVSVQGNDDAFNNYNNTYDKDGSAMEGNENHDNKVQLQREGKKMEVNRHSESKQTFTEANENVFTTDDVRENCSSYVNRTSEDSKSQIEESFNFTSSKIKEQNREGTESALLDSEEDYAGTSSSNNEREDGECSETIDVDLEADLIQSQRYQEGEEDMFSPITHVNETIFDQDRNVLKRENKKETCSHKCKRQCKHQHSNVSICIKDERLNDLPLQGKGFEKDEIGNIKNMWLLSKKERIRLYRYWLNCFYQRWRMIAGRAEETYDILCNDLDRMKAEEDERALRQATVIGMTTSCAARYHSVLQQIRPKIVVIEEAAEVLEAHILTSLTQDTEHVIMIGDHKQLRPKPTVYQLAQKFNLEISLFERMVLNKMDCKQLSIQHRMRPEIARLTKRIYDHEIFDSDRVQSYSDIRGMQKNMFFLDHTEPEEFGEGLQSYSNKHEADFVVALCRYLLQQGYQKSKITILTMYTGQMLYIKKKMPLNHFGGVRLSAVDNFQGEENDIVILSLVRSNKQESIGFLREPNRICVSLSRARMGFYVIGNFDLLCTQSPLWRDICKDLESEGQLGSSMPLICKKHGNVTDMKTAEDFEKVAEGGCNEPCEDRLQCGHVCDLPCHAGDPNHVEYQCRKKCLERCSKGHPCKKTCHYGEGCDKCKVEITKTFPDCEHNIKTACGNDVQRMFCVQRCEKELGCGHQCSRRCFESCDLYRCNVIVEKTLPCHHTQSVSCSKDPITLQCNEKCRKLLDCQHSCPGKCYQFCNTQVCKEKIEKLISCGHKIKVVCSEQNMAIECQEPCDRKLFCGHNCPNKCHETCPNDRCIVRVLKTLPCNHNKEMECHESPSDVFCKNPCERNLPCGHSCLQPCGNVCQRAACSQVVDSTLPCGHSQAVRCGDYPNFVCKASCDKLICTRDHRCKKKCHIGKEHCESCTLSVKVKIPECSHEVLAECWKDSSALKCYHPCQRTLACGHNCMLGCSEKCEASVCKEKMTKKLECGHTKDLPCFQDEKDYKCAVQVKKKLPCGHERKCSCHQNPEDVMCDVNVPITLVCLHTKQLPCSETEKVHERKEAVCCDVVVSERLHCGHEMELACGQDPKKSFCQAPCERSLSCGIHRCKKRCGDDCSKSVCQMKCTRQFKCGHRCSGLCGEECPRCKDECKRLLPCKHTCRGLCSEPCDPSKCAIRVKKQFPCGHKVKKGLPCSVSINAKCKQKCQRKLPCGHTCGGVCGRCRENGSHEKCRLPCGRILVCSHRCRAPCNEPCPPCTRPCQRSCVHGRCRKLCWEDCKPCMLPCAWSCPHFQCNNLCNENCSRSLCNEPCPKLLRCGHPCIGFCGEMCPTLCRVCSPRELAAIVQGGQQNRNIRFVQLFNCGHVFEVSFLDKWMHADTADPVGTTQIYLKRCPVCSVPVLFSFRYNDAAKRTIKNLNSVKLEIKEMIKMSALGTDSQEFVYRILTNLRFPTNFDLRCLISHDRTFLADTIRSVQCFKYALLLRNHVVVLRLLQEIRVKIETIRYNLRRSDFNLSNASDNTVSLMEEQVDNYLQAGPVLVSDMLHDILMDPQPDTEVMIKLYHTAVLVSLLVDLIDVKCVVLREFRVLDSVRETALKDTLNAMVTQTEALAEYKMGSLQLPNLLQWKTVAQLESEVNEIRQEAGLQPLEELPSVTFVYFPGLCRDNWFSCGRGHVFARFQTATVNARHGLLSTVVECQRCSQDDLAVGGLGSSSDDDN